MALIFEQSRSVSKGKGVENPKDERAPLQRIVS